MKFRRHLIRCFPPAGLFLGGEKSKAPLNLHFSPQSAKPGRISGKFFQGITGQTWGKELLFLCLNLIPAKRSFGSDMGAVEIISGPRSISRLPYPMAPSRAKKNRPIAGAAKLGVFEQAIRPRISTSLQVRWYYWKRCVATVFRAV